TSPRPTPSSRKSAPRSMPTAGARGCWREPTRGPRGSAPILARAANGPRAFTSHPLPAPSMRPPTGDAFPEPPPHSASPAAPRTGKWAMFLRNHDELPLEMVTDSERDYLWSPYASAPRPRINLGIRRRLAPLMDNDRRKIELMNSLLLSFPGTPILYYGDEIG